MRGRPRGSTARGRGKARGGRSVGGGSTKSQSRPWDDSDSDHAQPDYLSDSERESDFDSGDEDISITKRRKIATRLSGMDEEVIDLDEAGALSDIDGDCNATQIGESIIEQQQQTSCPWIDMGDDLPRLVLPESSNDLVLDTDVLLDAVEVYETCRSFYNSMKLSPFLFEDFCEALKSCEQSRLLSEIHISLMKIIFKDDEDDQILLNPQDMNHSTNIVFHLLEPMTYAEVLRQYLESDPMRFPSEVLAVVSVGNYPFVGVRQRLIVLSWLCDRFLHSNEFRQIVRNDGRIQHDEHCRDCGKPGDVILCDGCEACYHLACTDLKMIPDGQWLCTICQLHKIPGVTDYGSSSMTTNKHSIRLEPLGFDRHGRRYWFIVRRIFIQDEDTNDIYYYSTLPQLRQLCARLDSTQLEWQLCTTIDQMLPMIELQMTTTITLTNQRKLHDTSVWIFNDNYRRLKQIKLLLDEQKTTNLEIEHNYLTQKIDDLLDNANSSDNYLWSHGDTDVDSSESGEKKKIYRLGNDTLNGYRKYVNHYSTSDYAKTPYARAKERDRQKYMAGKFSLLDEGTFEWPVMAAGKDVYGSAESTAALLRSSLTRMSQKLAPQLMHRQWQSKAMALFKQSIESAHSTSSIRDLLLRFESCIRRAVFTQVWSNTLGHTRLMRCTTDDREWRQKIEKRKKAEEKMLMSADPEDDDSDIVWVKYTKLDAPPRHQIWKQKDEQYRVNGHRKFGGWMWISCLRRKLDCDSKTNKVERIEKIAQRLTTWRHIQCQIELNAKKRQLQLSCYSPSCRRGQQYSAVCGPNCGIQYCYSTECRAIQMADASDTRNLQTVSTAAIVKAMKPTSVGVRLIDEKYGNEKPFPLPKILLFTGRRCNKRSIMIQPASILRRIARQGGMGKQAPMGFHLHSKANTQAWPYQCSRPLFETCWRYLTQNANTCHAIALQLRILYACIRWSDMTPDDKQTIRMTVHHGDHDEIRTVIGHQELPPYGLMERYKLRVQLIPLDDDEHGLADDFDDDDTDDYRTSRGGSTRTSARKRRQIQSLQQFKNATNKTTKATLIEKWVDGADLKLWEIKQYWTLYESDRKYRTQGNQLLCNGNDTTQSQLNRRVGGVSILTSSTTRNTGMSNVNYAMTSGRTAVPIGNQQRLEIAAASRIMSAAVSNDATMAGGRFVSNSSNQRIIVRNSTSAGTSQSIRFVSSGNNITNNPRFTEMRQIPGKLLLIRSADGTTRYLRPITAVGTSSAQSTGSNVVSGGQRIVFASLDDHAGMAQSVRSPTNAPTTTAAYAGHRRILQPLPLSSTASGARFIRVPNPTTTTTIIPSTISPPMLHGIRVQPANNHSNNQYAHQLNASSSSLDNYSASSSTPNASIASSILRRRGATGDTYAGYYGEKSNDRIDADEYQMLAERGIRPPGRPPGRLSSTGYGQRTSGNDSDKLSKYSGGGAGRGQPRLLNDTLLFGNNTQQTSSLDGRRLVLNAGNTEYNRRIRELGRESSTIRRLSTFASENEERAIADAIAQEEERMRFDDEHGRHSTNDFTTDLLSSYSSNVGKRQSPSLPKHENADMKICKQVLDSIVSQVCKLDKQHGWSKQFIRKPRDRRDYDRQYRARKAIQRALENLLGDRMERIRKEIGKRRLDLEKKAEIDAGIMAAWRKPKSVRYIAPKAPPPHGTKRLFDSDRSTAVDPASITLSTGNKRPRLATNEQFASSSTQSFSTWLPPKSGPTLAGHHHSGDKSSTSTSTGTAQLTNGKTTVSRIDLNKLHCICQSRYDETKFYIACSVCDGWYHGSCVGISKKKARRMSSWSCDECKKEQKNVEQELYCVCRMPYDERQFYVGCDGCEGWYHPACVGISQIDAERMAEYLCPKCEVESVDSQPSTGVIVPAGPVLSRIDYPLLWRLLESLTEHRTSWPFREPVDADKYPNYYAIIKEPMDLSRVQRKLDDLEYQRLQEFIYDIGKIFDNARYYNPKDSPISQCADILEKRFRENLQSVKEEMGIRAAAADVVNNIVQTKPATVETLTTGDDHHVGVTYSIDDHQHDDDFLDVAY